MNVLTRTIRQAGKMIVGGLVGVSAGSAVVGGLWLNSMSTTGTEQKQTPFPAVVVAVIDLTASGSTSATEKYDSFCVSLAELVGDIGSGTIVRGVYDNIANPNAASVDIGFVPSCDSKTTSGSDLINDACTGTGCKSYYTTGTLEWMGNGDKDYLKATVKKDPTSEFDAKVILWIEDNLGQ